MIIYTTAGSILMTEEQFKAFCVSIEVFVHHSLNYGESVRAGNFSTRFDKLMKIMQNERHEK